MLKIGVLVSGGGTNLQAIIDGIANGTIHNTEISFVFSNSRKAYAMERAAKAGIPVECMRPRDFQSREEFDSKLLEVIDSYNVDLIVLAGCLLKIPESLVLKYENRIINIHPSLIPSFCGVGYYGLAVHEKALERGVKVTGATVHFVDTGTDTGPIILQKPVMVEDGDTPEVLQHRVMEQAEWVIMPEAINLIAEGRVHVTAGKVQVSPK